MQKMSLLGDWLVRSRDRPKADGKAVPAVNGDESERQVHEFLLGKLLARQLIHLVGYMLSGYQSDCFCPGESSPLSLGIEGRFSPGDKLIEPLFTFTSHPCIFCVHINAIGTAVDLRGTQLDQIDEGWFQSAMGQVFSSPNSVFIASGASSLYSIRDGIAFPLASRASNCLQRSRCLPHNKESNAIMALIQEPILGTIMAPFSLMVS